MRHKGRRWVLAANCRKSPMEAASVLPDLGDATEVKVHFGDRTVRAQAGRRVC